MYPKLPPGMWRCLFCHGANGQESLYEQKGAEYRKICKKCGATYGGSMVSRLGDRQDVIPCPENITRRMMLLWEEAP